MDSSPVRYETLDTVARVTLDDAARLNPLSEALLDGLADALARVRADPTIGAVLLTAAGRGFCVGADLSHLSGLVAGTAGESPGSYIGRLMAERANPLIAALRQLPVPVVCAVNGVAAGGGCGLALAADLVVAARSASFYLPFVPSLGAVPDMGSSWLLPRALGRARALGLMLTGEKLPAERAADWGLVWACVDDERLQAEALGLARRLAGLPPQAVGEVRALLAQGEHNSFEAQLELERTRQQVLADGASFAEGVRAFVERRAPVFRRG